MAFFGNFLQGRLKEASVERCLIVDYVMQLFGRSDFPDQVFIALEDSTVVNKGDVVWQTTDCEHPHDFIPLPGIADLITNLPTTAEFLRRCGAERMEDVTAEQKKRFWDEFDFEFAEAAGGVRLIWE